MNDRIRLSEAMGLSLTLVNGWYQWRDSEGTVFGGLGSRKDHMPPPIDPFTDANDDYAVLVWANKNLDHDAYFAALTEVVGSYCYLHEYRIGYFARAALKVIDDDNT